jgi:hypothetical protein
MRRENKQRRRRRRWRRTLIILFFAIFVLYYCYYYCQSFNHTKKEMSFRVVKKYKDAIKIASEDTTLTFERFLKQLKTKPTFQEAFNKVLAKIPYEAFFFECPPVNAVTVGKTLFEFVVRNSKHLAKAKSPYPRAFPRLPPPGTYGTAVFPNLSGDSILISPSECPKQVNYAHIASFSRNAPSKQIQMFWESVASSTLEHLKSQEKRPVWLSTSGLGISWLHIRLDSRPKYYTTDEYRRFSE